MTNDKGFKHITQPRGYVAILGSLTKHVCLATASFALTMKSIDMSKDLMTKEDKSIGDYAKGGICIVTYMASLVSGVANTFEAAGDSIDLAKRTKDVNMYEEYKKWRASLNKEDKVS